MSNFILNNFRDDKYNYIFIIHIYRNFDGNNYEIIYSLPDINPLINQIHYPYKIKSYYFYL